MTDSFEGTWREDEGHDPTELEELSPEPRDDDEDDQEIERAPQPGNTPAASPPFDSTLPRERPDPDQ
jgi:hypothetical protein